MKNALLVGILAWALCGCTMVVSSAASGLSDSVSDSVLNQYCQSWDVPNLFVTDGGAFVSNADKNPTLSIMSIAWRACDYVVEQLSQRSL